MMEEYNDAGLEVHFNLIAGLYKSPTREGRTFRKPLEH